MTDVIMHNINRYLLARSIGFFGLSHHGKLTWIDKVLQIQVERQSLVLCNVNGPNNYMVLIPWLTRCYIIVKANKVHFLKAWTFRESES